MTSTVAQAPTVLRRLIDERGIRHVFLADRIGVTRSHFTRLLNGERAPTAAFIEMICTQLGVEPEVFFDGRRLLIASENPMSTTNDVSGNAPTNGNNESGTPVAAVVSSNGQHSADGA